MNILYEDKDILVVEKPAGIPVEMFCARAAFEILFSDGSFPNSSCAGMSADA